MDDLGFTLNQLCAYFAIRVRDKSEPLDVHSELFEKVKNLKDAYESKSNWIAEYRKVAEQKGNYFKQIGWSCPNCGEFVNRRYPHCPYCLSGMNI